MSRFIPKFTAVLIFLLAIAGCKSADYTHYTSPEITGRVLAADTRLPIANVRVHRPGQTDVFEPFGPPKGGTMLMQPVPALTDAAGRFVLGSQSAFSLFRSPVWWTAPVIYEHAGYENFYTNYTVGDVITNTPAGAPVINAGDILLQPEVK